VGEEPGDSAQVIVPGCGVPLAGGTDPKAPVVPATEPAELFLEHATRANAPAAAHAASAIARRRPVTAEPGRRRDGAARRPPARGPVPGCTFRRV